jgi:SpoVK/Ycf46/Vps4 family AAA+-type ATPase
MIKNIVSHLNDKIENEIKPIDEKDDDKIEQKYYEFCGKKYNINIQKIINLIEPLTKLNNLIGMEKIKENILDMIIYYIQKFESSTTNMLHTTIEGPPGVGKSKLGRILAHIYNGLGVIESKRFVRVRRTDLIGKYLGHTAHKTQEVIDKAEGGVLFIDEAYSLGSGSENDIYSKECIDTINMNLTEKKKKLIVIIAGYADELDRSFFSFNEGLKRRFPFRYQIDGYTHQEMTQIFYYMIRKLGWKLDKSVTFEYLESFFQANKKEFNNYAGDIETVILECKITHARRVLGQPLNIHKILNKTDIESAFKKFITNKKSNKVDLTKLSGMYT